MQNTGFCGVHNLCILVSTTFADDLILDQDHPLKLRHFVVVSNILWKNSGCWGLLLQYCFYSCTSFFNTAACADWSSLNDVCKRSVSNLDLKHCFEMLPLKIIFLSRKFLIVKEVDLLDWSVWCPSSMRGNPNSANLVKVGLKVISVASVNTVGGHFSLSLVLLLLGIP